MVSGLHMQDRHLHESVGEQAPLTHDAIKALRVLLGLKLTGNQLLVLSRLKDLNGLEHTMTSLVLTFSRELKLSEPTVRRTMQLCRRLGLISCGDKNAKGKTVKLTPLGRKVLEEIEAGGDAKALNRISFEHPRPKARV